MIIICHWQWMRSREARVPPTLKVDGQSSSNCDVIDNQYMIKILQ